MHTANHAHLWCHMIGSMLTLSSGSPRLLMITEEWLITFVSDRIPRECFLDRYRSHLEALAHVLDEHAGSLLQTGYPSPSAQLFRNVLPFATIHRSLLTIMYRIGT
jgi:hypothetical protein